MIVTNYEGTVISFNGTEAEALNQGYNVNCIACSSCSNCSNCSNCSYCSNCSNCSYCSNCSKQPICIITTTWVICIRDESIKIGCKDYLIEQWMGFMDDHISTFDNNALSFWKQWKPVIQTILAQRATQTTSTI